MSTAVEVLNSLVALEAQIVTYRRLSRELKVHVNTAKQLLAEFHEAHKDSCQATYLVTGTRQIDSGSELGVKLVAESELDATRQELDNAHYHVYSVGPRVDTTKEAMVMANVLAGSIQDIAEHCAVGSSVSKVIDSAPKLTTSVVAEPIEQPEPKHVAKPEPKPAVKSEPKPVVKSEPKPPTNKQETKPKSKSFFGRSIGTKKAPKKEPESQESDESSNQAKPETSSAQSAADASFAQPEDNNSSAQPETNNSSSTEEKPRVEDMFMDDDDDFETTPVKVEETQTPDESMDMQADSDYRSKESSDVEMADAENDASSARESQSAQPDESQSTNGRRRVRKRRKVSKIKHTKNSRGMLVSQAVDEWESYSESESDSEAKPRMQTAAKKPAGKNKGAPQRSILSFFGKK
ncbi:hypothetical protein GGF43_002047 [Coemansia sp. RSA 2618]|nr:hypothetical protein GGF43_002047 [Coemansia sp. RSA 2618]